MVLKLFKSLFGRSERAGPCALKDRRVFAIGDIHGCDALLEAMLGAIAQATAKDANPPLLVFLGDYVDRGLGSRAVIERLVNLKQDGWDAYFLCGNHEETMLRFLDDIERGLAWPGYGGVETMLSYGVQADKTPDTLPAWRAVQHEFRAAIPLSHMRFLRGLEDQLELGDYLFVHAGINPQRALNDQTSRDLRWIRDPFLLDDKVQDKIIVHGHTPSGAPHHDHRRIGVDTWAYNSGVLTAAEMHDATVRFLQVRQTETGIVSAFLQAGAV